MAAGSFFMSKQVEIVNNLLIFVILLKRYCNFLFICYNVVTCDTKWC